MFNYPNLLAGAKGLLCDCVNILSQTHFEYVIVGGWSPLLLNSNPIQHPGTHDVDLLFKNADDTNKLEEVFKMFLSKGYISSAKHNFQLLKVLHVNSQEFVYNVDILHTSDNDGKEDMFVDHLKLPVPLREYCSDSYFHMSIKAANSDAIFADKLYELISEDFILFDGTNKKIAFPLINEAGLIITKSESVKKTKRERDAFDIFLAIKQARNYSNLVDTFIQLKCSDPKTFNTLYGIRAAIDKFKMVENILKYHIPNSSQNSSDEADIKDFLIQFLKDVRLDKKAKQSYNQ